MENKERNLEENTVKEGVIELCNSCNHITISVDKFTELVEKEAALNLVKNIHFNSDSYDIKRNLTFLFGPVPEKDDDTF